MKKRKVTKYRATVNLWLDKRKELKAGGHAVKVQLYYMGKTMRYDTGRVLSQADWDKTFAPNLKDPALADCLKHLTALRAKANRVIDELGDNFNFDNFAWKFCGRTPKNVRNKQDVYLAFEDYMKQLKEEQRIGTESSYRTSMKSFQKFSPKLEFRHITVAFLQKYEKWMLDNDKSITTVGINVRNLRAIMNIAKADKIINEDQYPFGTRYKKKYEIPTSRNVKLALSMDDLRKVFNNKPVSDHDAWSIDMWMFSFYCNGMNMGDIFKLKHEDIKGDYIHFIREKTKNNKKEIEPVVVYITDPIREIIDKWGDADKSSKAYIFGVYTDGMPPEEKYRVKHFTIRRINAALKRMTVRIGIDSKITTYTARHTWASYLNEKDASISYISKGLGHTSLKTTENYLASFSANKMRKMGDMISDLRDELLDDIQQAQAIAR